MKSTRILITGGGSGGHVSPALAVAEILRRENPETALLYVGGKLTMEGATGPSIEEQLVAPTGIPFVAIHAGKLKRDGRLSVSTVKRLWGVVPGMSEAYRVVRRFCPDVVFSSGGYVSVPVVLAAALLRIPVVIHEQTSVVGLANQIAGKVAWKVALTFPQSARYFADGKAVVTGNPMRPEVLQSMPGMDRTALGRWLDKPGRPVVYITGGGLGSHVLNVAVEAELRRLLTHFRIVHQCGSHAGFGDFQRLKAISSELPQDIRDNYWLSEHFTSKEVGLIYAHTAGVVARAGANTVLELAAWGMPTVFVPIPWVTHDEQTKNAQILVEAGIASILPEAQLSGQTLYRAIERLTTAPVSEEAKQRARHIVQPAAGLAIVELLREAILSK